MIVGDLDIERLAVAIAEADSPLVVDPDAPLPGAIPAQRLEAIRRRHAQILDAGRRIQLNQSHHCALPNLRRITAGLPFFPEALRPSGAPPGRVSIHVTRNRWRRFACHWLPASIPSECL